MKSIINVRRSSICWRGQRELITDVRKPKSWLWRHCRRRADYDYSDHPLKLVINPKLKSTGAGRYQLLLIGRMPTTNSSLKDFSPKSQDAVALQQIGRGALPMIDRGDIRQAIDRCSNIWSTAGRGCGQFEHKADSLIAKFKEAGGTVREIDVWAESPRLSPLWDCLPSSACIAGC